MIGFALVAYLFLGVWFTLWLSEYEYNSINYDAAVLFVIFWPLVALGLFCVLGWEVFMQAAVARRQRLDRERKRGAHSAALNFTGECSTFDAVPGTSRVE